MVECVRSSFVVGCTSGRIILKVIRRDGSSCPMDYYLIIGKKGDGSRVMHRH